MALSSGQIRSVTITLGAALFSCGVIYASTMPYAAIVGINILGIPSQYYAILVSCGAVFGALASVALGRLSDHIPDRRFTVLFSAAAGALAYLLIFLFRNKVVFFISVGLILPLGYSIFSQCLSFCKVYFDANMPERSDFMMAVMRTVFSMAWAVTPPLAGYVANKWSAFEIYLVASGAYIFCGVVFFALILHRSSFVPSANVDIQRNPANAGSIDIPKYVLIGLVSIFVFEVAMRIVGIVMPLAIVSIYGGDVTQVGLYAGVAAALEIPFMVIWSRIAQRFGKEKVIFIGGLLFVAYLGLAVLSSSFYQILLLQALNGLASSALLVIPITYMQESIRGRIGLSTSLIDVVHVIGTLAAAAIFGLLINGDNFRVLLFAAAVLALGASFMMLISQPRVQVKQA